MAQHKLVIAEKPSVAQSLAAVIGATVRKDGYLEGNGDVYKRQEVDGATYRPEVYKIPKVRMFEI